MRVLHILLACTILFATGACQKPIQMTSDLNAGEYKIAMLDIQPATAELADNPEYWTMKKKIKPRLMKKLPYLGGGPAVGLKISIYHVNTSINAAKAMLIADSYKLWANIQLWDLETKRQLARTKVQVSGDAVAGLAGLTGHGLATMTFELEEKLADKFVEQIIWKLYPQTKGKNFDLHRASSSFLIGQ